MVMQALNIGIVYLFENLIVFGGVKQPLQTYLFLLVILLYQNEVWNLDIFQSKLRFATPKEFDK